MKFKIFLSAIIFLLSAFFMQPAIALTEVEIKAQDYCQEMGYSYNETDKTCVFLDGKSCLALFFYGENCGNEYVKKLPCVLSGKLDTPATYCCENLDPLRPYKIDTAGNCQYLGSEIYSTCSDCGNGVCESWENSCNCRSDCKKAGDDELLARVNGRILLQVKEKGEAWYVNPADHYRYYLGDGDSAYGIMWSLNLGISNSNLNKIPIGVLDSLPSATDTDNDGLDDQLETAIGTKPDNVDTDNDGFSDKDEIIKSYNPVGSGLMAYNLNLTNRLKGKILLQVEGHGEAWYVNPVDGKRYYLKDGAAAYQVMSKLGLGITNEDLFPITRGGIFIPYHNKLKKIELNTYTVSYPLGWVINSQAGDSVQLHNFHKKTVMGVGDNNGEFKGDRIELIIYSEADVSDNYQNVKECSEKNNTTVMINSINSYKCYNAPSYRATAKVNGKYYFIKSDYYAKNSAIVEAIEKILNTIKFKNNL